MAAEAAGEDEMRGIQQAFLTSVAVVELAGCIPRISVGDLGGDAGTGDSAQAGSGQGGRISAGGSGNKVEDGSAGSGQGGRFLMGGSGNKVEGGSAGTQAGAATFAEGGQSEVPSGGFGSGGSGSTASAQFRLFGPLDSGPTPRPDRTYYVTWIGASGDGSMLAGVSSFTDAAVGFRSGVRFYWTPESGTVKLDSGSPTSGLYDPSILSANGASLFGRVYIVENGNDGSQSYYPRSFYRWTREAGDEVFGPPSMPYGGQIDFVSADGTTALGMENVVPGSDQLGPRFRWSRDKGYQYLSDLGWPANSDYLAMSEDGKVIVGHRHSNGTTFVWSEAGQLLELGTLPGFPYCAINTLSKDGSVGFGACHPVEGSTQNPQAFRWTAQTGMVALEGAPYSNTTRDGRVAMSSDEDALYRWTADSGVVELEPPADWNSITQYSLRISAGSLSDDGSSVYGELNPPYDGTNDFRTEAFHWTERGGFERLDRLPGDTGSFISAGARDGSVLVGFSGKAKVRNAVLWDCQGIRDITGELLDAGVDLQGVQLTDASYVWSGPTVMVAGRAVDGGNGARAWIAWLPKRCS